MVRHGLDAHRHGDNVWTFLQPWDDNLPTLLLNSHIDTVRPCDGWTTRPIHARARGRRHMRPRRQLSLALRQRVHFYRRNPYRHRHLPPRPPRIAFLRRPFRRIRVDTEHYKKNKNTPSRVLELYNKRNASPSTLKQVISTRKNATLQVFLRF